MASFSLATTGFPAKPREIAIPRKEPGQPAVLEKKQFWGIAQIKCTVKPGQFILGALRRITEFQSSGQLLGDAPFTGILHFTSLQRADFLVPLQESFTIPGTL